MSPAFGIHARAAQSSEWRATGMARDESADWDATEMAAAIRSGAVSALEMVDAAIARAEALDPQLNFLVTEDFARARERARAPLGDG
eukprot:gene61635-84300_t